MEQTIRSMGDAVNRKFSIYLGLFGLSFFMMRSARGFGKELLLALLLLLPYAILTALLSGYLTKAANALRADRPASRYVVTPSSVERVKFFTKWALLVWPPFAGLAFATLVLSIVEPLTNRGFIPFHLDRSESGYCRFFDYSDGAATFHCFGSELQALQSYEELARARAEKQHQVCTNQFFAQFRRTAVAFQFIYREGIRIETIEVRDKDCANMPPQPS